MPAQQRNPSAIVNFFLKAGQCYANSDNCKEALLNKEGERFNFILLTDRPGKSTCVDANDLCHPEYGRNQTLAVCEEYMEWYLN
jgi:hypothetical protein